MSGKLLLNVPPLMDPEAEQAALQKSLRYLVTAGINADRFHRDNINALYLPVRDYLKEVRVLTSITDPELLTHLFAAAAEAGEMEKPESLDAPGLLKLARWAQKGNGLRNNVTYAQQMLKIAAARGRSRGLDSDPKTVTFVLLNEMLQDIRAEEEEIRSRNEAIERLQNQINVLEMKFKQEMKRIEKKYEPASLYKPPNKEPGDRMAKLCYERYVKDCEEKNVQPVAWSPCAAQKIEAEWSDVVLAEHRIEFIRNPVVADQLKAWCRTKLEELEAVQDSRGSAELRRLLANMDEEPIERNI